MKRLTAFFLFIMCITSKPYACGPSWEPDYNYYNLFMQEIIDDPQYYPFLVTFESPFYGTDEQNTLNENIEEWANYFNIKYEDARYLVFDVLYPNLSDIIKGERNTDEKLRFMTPDFIKKYKQALQYLLYAKYLEPYMSVTVSDNSWYYYYPEDRNTVDDLDYGDVISTLQKNWKSVQDKELKLRYGYQLVRFAHYKGNYDQALSFFDIYVDALNYKPVMYYHALAHKAGAERGLGNIMQANADYFLVFSHSKNLKKMTLTSIRMTNESLNKDFLDGAKTQEEKNDAYLLLGYLGFSSPLNEIEKIIRNTPDAIQAKVLMARAVNIIERDLLSINTYFYYYRQEDNFPKSLADKRYPVMRDANITAFLDNTLALTDKMTSSSSVKEKDYWYLTSAYLHFLKKEFTEAKELLSKVKSTNKKYIDQKNNLTIYIDICEQPTIDSKAENMLYAKYKDKFFSNFKTNTDTEYDTRNFVIDVLANRYYIQKDYGKAFLLHNGLETLKLNPDLKLLDEIEAFYNKKNKTNMEESIASSITPEIQDKINYIRGIIYLTDANLEKALASFSKMKRDTFDFVSSGIFGYNKIESFDSNEDDVIVTNYFSDFPFIREVMSERELVEALIKLRSIGEQNTNLSPKANYLLGNFYYNTTRTGYYRQILRFDQTNGYCSKFDAISKPDLYNNIYFKYYSIYYKNNIHIPIMFLEKAYAYADDDTLKARIAFALSKCEQEVYYDNNNVGYYYAYNNKSGDDGILITKRKYFKELAKYKNTDFYNEVKTNCKYFEYYINYCM